MKFHIAKKLLLLSLSIPALSMQASAVDGRPSSKTATPFIDQREENMRRRIGEGIKSGELTASEAKLLQNELKQIERLKEQARRGGVVIEQTRRNLRKAIEKLDEDIYRLTHNSQKAPSVKPSASPSFTAKT